MMTQPQVDEMHARGFWPDSADWDEWTETRAKRTLRCLRTLQVTCTEIGDAAGTAATESAQARALEQCERRLEKNYGEARACIQAMTLTDGEREHDLQAVDETRRRLLALIHALHPNMVLTEEERWDLLSPGDPRRRRLAAFGDDISSGGPGR